MKTIIKFVKIILLIIISSCTTKININQKQELNLKNMKTKKELLIEIATKRAILTEIIQMIEEDEYDIHKRNLKQAKEELKAEIELIEARIEYINPNYTKYE